MNLFVKVILYFIYYTMGSKSSKVTIKDAKLDTALGSFGCGSCTSSCCVDQVSEEEQQPKDPRLEYIEKMVKVEIGILEHMLLKKMIEHFEEGVVPEISINEQSKSIKVDLENPTSVENMKLPSSVQKKIEESKVAK